MIIRLSAELLPCRKSHNPAAKNIPATILMSGEMLAKTKMRIAKDDPELSPAMAKLIKMADAALGEGPYSVTEQ